MDHLGRAHRGDHREHRALGGGAYGASRMKNQWIVVRNWEKFQNADVFKKSHGRPPWIKNYVRLLHDDAYISLTPHQRAVLHGIWLIYASSGCQVRVNTLSLTRQLGLRVSSRQLKSLSDAGFITFSSRNPRDSLAIDSSQEESREDKSFSSNGYVDVEPADLKTSTFGNLSDERFFEVAKLLDVVKGVDPHSRQVIEAFAVEVPPSVLADIADRARGKDVKWAVSALKAEAKERA